ncbi:MAG TPA: FAD-dependent oxidoreductase, partial [Candidatus Latescibacteria bacterium]|nr:FAD-dependent oxidoreductase [Candidatus Latescibacterota bacterium]
EDYLARRSFPDEICRNAYGIDVHGQKNRIGALTNAGIEAFKKANEELTRPYEKGESFGVPYRCLTPKGLKNVLVGGRCISADRQANGSIRIMACCLNTGEAAGIGAAMAAKDTRDVHGVNTDELRAKLKAFGAYLPTA